MEWKPIGSAPQDGTTILVRSQGRANTTQMVSWNQRSGGWCALGVPIDTEAHEWAPLPSADILQSYLEAARGNLTRAARAAGVPRAAMLHVLKIAETRGRRNIRENRDVRENRMLAAAEKYGNAKDAAAAVDVELDTMRNFLRRRMRLDLLG